MSIVAEAVLTVVLISGGEMDTESMANRLRQWGILNPIMVLHTIHDDPTLTEKNSLILRHAVDLYGLSKAVREKKFGWQLVCKL